MLILLLVSVLNRGTIIADKPNITGAFGLVLGEKYTNSPYGDWLPEVAGDATGGSYLTASGNSQNQDLPFIFINAHADENGRIYWIVGDNRGQLSSSALEDLCKVTAETLGRKYPLYRYDPTSQTVWIFGDAKRCIELRHIPFSLVIEYRDKELEQAFHERVKEAKESAIRKSLKRQKL